MCKEVKAYEYNGDLYPSEKECEIAQLADIIWHNGKYSNFVHKDQITDFIKIVYRLEEEQEQVCNSQHNTKNTLLSVGTLAGMLRKIAESLGKKQ